MSPKKPAAESPEPAPYDFAAAVARFVGPGIQSISVDDAVRVAQNIVSNHLLNEAAAVRAKAERENRIAAAIANVNIVGYASTRVAPGNIDAIRTEWSAKKTSHSTAVNAYEKNTIATGTRALGILRGIAMTLATGGATAGIGVAVAELAALGMEQVNGSETEAGE